MEIFITLLFFCFGPLAIFLFGVWVGRGAPGWPWRVVRRDAARSHQAGPYDEFEEVYDV